VQCKLCWLSFVRGWCEAAGDEGGAAQALLAFLCAGMV
jgi:hypothetical protein